MGEPIVEQGYEAGICGHDGDNWEKILIDEAKRLVVAVASFELPDGAATAANQVLQLASMLRVSGSPIIYNVEMTSADTEYSQALGGSTKKFMIKCRGSYDIKLAFVSTESGTNYVTVPSATCYWDDLLMTGPITLYFQCATAGQVAEIVRWG